MTTAQPIIPNAAQVPPLGHDEAGVMARTELEQFLDLARSLSPGDWDKPTDCTLWNVRQIVAHQAGAYASFAGWGQFRRQFSQLLKKPGPGQVSVDLINERQVADRAGLSPAELIAELAEVGPRGIRTRERLPAFLRGLRLPFGPPLGVARIDYLTDLIYTRDTWCHRLDICRAAGREMHLTPGHDGRLIALVMRDLAAHLSRRVKGVTVDVELGGPAGGCWRIGPDETASAAIEMDALDFSRLASGRLTLNEARAGRLVSTRGDDEAAGRVLQEVVVPF